MNKNFKKVLSPLFKVVFGVLSVFLVFLCLFIEIFVAVFNSIYRYLYSKTPQGMMAANLRNSPLSIIQNHDVYKEIDFNKFYVVEYPYIQSIHNIDYLSESIVFPPKYSFIGYCFSDMSRNMVFKSEKQKYRALLLHFFEFFEYDLDIKIDDKYQQTVMSHIIYKENLYFFKKFTKNKKIKEFIDEKNIISILFHAKDLKLVIHLIDNIDYDVTEFLICNHVNNNLPLSMIGKLDNVSLRVATILRILRKRGYDISNMSIKLENLFSNKDRSDIEKVILSGDSSLYKLGKKSKVKKI